MACCGPSRDKLTTILAEVTVKKITPDRLRVWAAQVETAAVGAPAMSRPHECRVRNEHIVVNSLDRVFIVQMSWWERFLAAW